MCTNSYNYKWFLIIFIIFYLINLINSAKLLESRIVGGMPAPPNSVKYQASLRMKSSDRDFGEGFFCSGSLITKLTILTAAHCMFIRDRQLRPDEIKIVLGTPYLNTSFSHTIIRSVSRIIIHENYDEFENDVALIILSESIPTNHSAVEPIILSNVTALTDDALCQIYGWGSSSFHGSANNELMMANVSIIDVKQCNESDSYGGEIIPGMICAGNFTNGGVDACQGDSGGPLVCDNTLVGVVSWGTECGLPKLPGVYTDVAYYREWILKNNGFCNMVVTLLSRYVILCILIINYFLRF